MIPKIIHFCWFGGSTKNKMIEKCINSWKKYCPDYEIIEWNESNYDTSKQAFVKRAYDEKKWAFVSDYARIDILYKYGGIYLDTDVELLSCLDSFLEYDFYAGFESNAFVNFGIGFGSIKDHFVLRDILDFYKNIEFPNNDFDLSMLSCPRIQTDALKKYGLICNNKNQVFNNCYIFNSEYFCPMSFKTGKIQITDKTVSIHHFDMSWNPNSFKSIKYLEWRIIEIWGEKWGKIISSLVSFPSKIIMHKEEGTLAKYILFLLKRKS